MKCTGRYTDFKHTLADKGMITEKPGVGERLLVLQANNTHTEASL